MVTFKRRGDELQCVFSGRLDTNVCQQLEGSVREQMETGPAWVVFDMAEVEYISSMFLRLCIQTAKQVDTGSFSLVNARPEVKSVFQFAGLTGMLSVQ